MEHESYLLISEVLLEQGLDISTAVCRHKVGKGQGEKRRKQGQYLKVTGS